MKPVCFSCNESISLAAEEIAAQLLDLEKWAEFEGYGVMPGIASAEFEIRTPETLGTRIRVNNTDGSTHTEEIVEWEPTRRVQLHMSGFSPPVSRLASHFVETWEFERVNEATMIERSFELHAKSIMTRPILWMISFLLKKAIQRQLRQMRVAAK